MVLIGDGECLDPDNAKVASSTLVVAIILHSQSSRNVLLPLWWIRWMSSLFWDLGYDMGQRRGVEIGWRLSGQAQGLALQSRLLQCLLTSVLDKDGLAEVWIAWRGCDLHGSSWGVLGYFGCK